MTLKLVFIEICFDKETSSKMNFSEIKPNLNYLGGGTVLLEVWKILNKPGISIESLNMEVKWMADNEGETRSRNKSKRKKVIGSMRKRSGLGTRGDFYTPDQSPRSSNRRRNRV